MKRRTGYLFKRGPNFYVKFVVAGKTTMKSLRDDNGQPITSRREAEEARDKFMSPLACADEATVLRSIAGRLEGRNAEIAKFHALTALTISAAWSAFLDSNERPDTGGETLYQYSCQWSAFADWARDKHPEILALNKVTVDIAAEYAKHLERDAHVSEGTFNKHMNLLTLVFNTLKARAIIVINPWLSIRRKRLATVSRRELTVDELRRICKSATGELRVLLAVGIYSGLRLGDAATLRWCEVDFDRGKITRIANKTARRPNSKPLLIPVHPALRKLLEEIPAEPRSEYVMPDLAAKYIDRIDLVTDRIQGHFKDNGITVHKPGTGPGTKKRAQIEVGFHSLRHSFISMCSASNTPLSVVESLVGHSNPAMTRHYTHVGELAANTAIASLPEFIGDPKPVEKKADPETLLTELKTKLRAIADSMTRVNWRDTQAELAILAAA